MGNAASRVSQVLFAAGIACMAGAHAQQEPTPSPYTLGWSVARAPLAASCPGMQLHCSREPGLNLSLVGRAQLSSFGVFGKVGTTSFTRSDTTAMGAMPGTDLGSSLSWGGGVSYDFTPRLSAAFEFVSYELRAPAGPLRTTNLGLQFRY